MNLSSSSRASSGDKGQAIAAVFLCPSISITSPGLTPIWFNKSMSTLTFPLPTSFCLASTTLNISSFLPEGGISAPVLNSISKICI